MPIASALLFVPYIPRNIRPPYFPYTRMYSSRFSFYAAAAAGCRLRGGRMFVVIYAGSVGALLIFGCREEESTRGGSRGMEIVAGYKIVLFRGPDV